MAFSTRLSNGFVPNFHTIVRAAETLRSLGVDVQQINAPGNTSVVSMHVLAKLGATHVEPGHGLLGTTPNHAFRADLPELPTYTYVSEVSHHFDRFAYAYGGGLFQDIEQIIDYHAVLEPGDACRVGDTALFGFRTQMQMTRSYVAPVFGVTSGNIELPFLFDHANTALDANYDPVDPTVVRDDIDRRLAHVN